MQELGLSLWTPKLVLISNRTPPLSLYKSKYYCYCSKQGNAMIPSNFKKSSHLELSQAASNHSFLHMSFLAVCLLNLYPTFFL